MVSFSIITVCYNENKGIRKTLESVLNQTWQNFELIIVDGGSADGTSEIVKSYETYHNVHVISEKDRGVYHAMNKGIAYSQNDFLIFLNGGDYFYDNNVLQSAAFQIKAKKQDIYYGTAHLITSHGKMITLLDFGSKRKTFWEYLIKKRMPSHQAIFTKKEIMKKHPFDEKYKITADFNWFAICCKKKFKMSKLDLLVSEVVIGGISTKPSGKFKCEQETNHILKENFPLRYRLHLMKIWCQEFIFLKL